MAASVDTIEAVLNSCDCKLKSITHRLEESLAVYESVQRTMSEDSTLAVNPLALLGQLNKVNDQLARVVHEYGRVKKRREDLHLKYGQESSELDSKVSSSLEYLVTQKKRPGAAPGNK